MRPVLQFLAAALVVTSVYAASPVTIKVLRTESREYEAPPQTRRGCNFQDLNAYCTSAAPVTYVEHRLTIQEPDGRAREVSCTVYRGSHCANLVADQSYYAQMEKRGVKILYRGPHHRLHKQFYAYVAGSD